MENKIYDSVKTIKPANKKYVHRNDAEKFIDLSEKAGLGVLGFDGIYCKVDSIEPDMDLIADFSNLKKEVSSSVFVRESCEAARRVIQEFPIVADLYIDFVLEAESITLPEIG
tara:strand:- start:1024 stop:1362 length:339 start_codon:yes stop_codon:yes gene_type:complete